ncbi:hypothetical protein ACFLTK_02280 [Chloroflexota bacterium]
MRAISTCFETRWPNITILVAGEGGKGLELIEVELPNMVILILSLPDIDEFEILSQTRLFLICPSSS